MKYLLTYSAEVDGGNGTYNEDFKELYDKIEDIYEEIAHLESKEGKDFSFQIFELHFATRPCFVPVIAEPPHIFRCSGIFHQGTGALIN